MWKPNRRSVLLGGAAATFGLSTLSTTRVLAQDARLRYLFWGGPGRSDRKLETYFKFADRIGVEADGEWSPWGDYWPRLSTQIAGGNAPDLIQMDYRYIFEYARRGVLLPLDQYIPDPLDISAFGEQRINSGKVDGNIYGVTIGDNSMGWAYDSDTWSELGIELTNDMTWEDYKAKCAEFKAASTRDDYYASNNAGGSEPAMEIWLRQRNKALYVDSGLGFDEADATEWFAMWLEMSDQGLAPPADIVSMQQSNIEGNLFTLGHVASSPHWSNEITPISQITDFDVAIVPFPTHTAGGYSGHYLKPSQFMSIYSESQNPEVAAQFINYLTNTLEAAKDQGVDTAIPPSPTVRDEIAPTLDPIPRKSLEFVNLIEQRAGALPIPPLPGAGEVQQVLTDTNLQVLYGALSPEAGGQQLVQGAQGILERAS